MQIVHGAMGSTFARMLRKCYKYNGKRNMPDPTNPFGNPCGFGLALHSFGTEVWRYSHVTSWCQNWRSEAPERWVRSFLLAKPKAQAGGCQNRKIQTRSGLRVRHQCWTRRGGMVPEPWRILGRRFGATVSHLMVPELEQPSARPARSAGRKNQFIFILFCQKWKIGSGRDLGSDLVSAEGGSYRGPTPKRKHP